MTKPLHQFALAVLCGLAVLALGLGFAFKVQRGRNSERTARFLLATWNSNVPRAASGALWSVPPAPEFPGFDLSVGRLNSGLGIAVLRKQKHWYSLSQELGLGLVQSPENPSLWRLSETRCYRIAGYKVLSRRADLATITDSVFLPEK